jgi:integral membrane sensor domain MASE1
MSLQQSAICTALMLGWFSALLTIGFWLRHGHWIWEGLIT